MKPNIHIKSIFIALFAVLGLIGLSFGTALGAYNCANGAQDPPFLAAGVKPNLMMLIDNSASMYDMAYTGDNANCYDGTDRTTGTETYDPATEYGGYFKTNTWYDYDVAKGVFEASVIGNCNDPAGGAAYQYSGEVCATFTGDVVTFGARGNFMNWATTSKFDIQKQVLTGGKFDDASDTLTSEGRGCSGSRFIKQVIVKDSGGATFYLNLGIHPVTPPDMETDDPGDPTTAIALFQVTETGFDNTACNQAVELMADEKTSLGTLKGLIDECMEYDNNQSYTSAEGPAFNQAVQSCWYWDKHGFPEMTGDEKAQHAVSIRNHCEDLYAIEDPEFIGPESPGYVCQGKFDGKDDGVNEGSGYVGRCWVPEVVIVPGVCFPLECKDGAYTNGSSAGSPVDIDGGDRCNGTTVEYCSGNYNSNQNSCNKAWLPKEECPGGGATVPGGWVVTDTDTCVTNALYDFCGRLELPQVVDPSDQTQDTGEVYNLPAMLTDTGASGQLGDPLLTMTGVIYDNAYAAERPTGILHDVANNIRLGAMKLNYDGAQAECALRDADAAADPKLATILYKCDSTIDGSSVVTGIDDETTNPGHIDQMVTDINAIKANAWTPLAEAVFNAIGYYTQRDDMRLNADDFTIGDPEPCTDWCQSNNILIITEGASTADLNQTVTDFAAQDGQHDGDGTDTATKCNDLYGSTYLDDITYYGFNGHDIHKEGDDWTADEHFQNIRSYFVVAGTPRTQGAGECSPTQMLADAALNGGSETPYYADNPQDLKDKLKEVLDLIGARAAAGSAASVISATRGGEGAIYQAIFWPSLDGPVVDGEIKHKVTWTGEVHALLIDAYGKMYEDTDNSSSITNDDEQVVLYYDTDLKKSMACDQDLEADGTCGGTSKSLQNVDYLWSAAEWMADIPDASIVSNRATIGSDAKKRFIFTWTDLDNDGVVDANEQLPFEARNDWDSLTVNNRAPVPYDFGVATNDEVNRIVKWVRGLDTPADATLRPREVPTPDNFTITGSPATITWRLGDVVHSTPTAVSRPAEGYHLLYQDGSYAEYFDEHQYRRHVVYFGGNDGMVHALNAGFYDAANQAFRRGYDPDTGTYSDTGPELGAELWGYVPYNLLPHLKCMTEPDYQHKYYVDLKPRVFDVQMFENSPDTLGHVKGWGTIMVVGMRFGGARTYAQDIIDQVSPGAYTDNRIFTSAYMVFDISDPLNPRLLGETTYDTVSDPPSVDLAYTAAVPAVVPIKAEADGSDWYLILGSGPTDVTGVSDQKPRIGMYPLTLLDTPYTNAFRIPDSKDSITHLTAGSYVLEGSANGFVSDTVTVDYDLLELFKADVLYFGTVEGDWGNWGGHLYRWVTNGSDPQSWKAPAPMIDAKRPVSAAPTIGYDGIFYWVYFGTGRFYHVDDKTDNAQEYFFGLKEPVDRDQNVVNSSTDEFTWATIQNNQTTVPVVQANDAGARTILPVGGIEVKKANDPAFATLNCKTGQDGCLPSGVGTFADLQEYIVGYCQEVDGCTGTDGWAMELEEIGERNLGQAALLGGLLTFTTYKPFADVCKPEGHAFLYGVFYQTGTAFYEPVFTTSSGGGTYTGDAGTTVVTSRLSIGRGLAMTPNLHVGRQEGSTAFVQTSTGTIVEIPQPNLPIKNTKSGKLTWQGTCD